MSHEYTPIEVKKKHSDPESIIEVELEDITDEPQDTDLEDNKDDIVVEDTKKKAVVVDEDDENSKKKTPPKKKPSRAEKRIKQLHSEKEEERKAREELEAQLEEERKARVELEKQLKTGTKQSKQDFKEALQQSLSTLTKALSEAIQDGDADQAVTLQDKMMDVKMQLAGLEAELHQLESTPDPEYKEPEKKQQAPQVPEKALEWIEEYPQFKTDQLFHVAAITVSNTLINEGYDDQSDEFYEELNERLSPRFPEVFGIEDKNDVKYKKNTSEEETDENQNSSTNQNEDISSDEDEDSYVVEQVVSSSSRTPPHSGGKKPSTGKKIKLSAADVEQAKRWGLSLEQMARRKAHTETNQSEDGYTPILIDRK